jgi:cellulose synthase/poly-beta-1,6-N-acetylglucosamine synthase-like glycosyltransferase
LNFAVDPVATNILFTLNLLPHLSAPSHSPPYELPDSGGGKTPLAQPLVSVIVPLHNESTRAVAATVTNLAAQDYPNFEILYALERNDSTTKIPPLNIGRSQVVVSDGKRALKAYAMNAAIKKCRGDIVVVYDAGSDFPPDQISKAVALMQERGYDVVQPKSFRKSVGSVWSSFLELDNVVWTRKFVPFFQRLAGFYPLCGSGVFIRKSVLESVGGYPEVLTEDAYLSLLLAERRYKFGLLDSTITKESPNKISAQFRQRVRWFRGFVSCSRKLIFSKKIPLKAKLLLVPAFFSPFTVAATMVSWIFFMLYWSTWAIGSREIIAPWMTSPIYGGLFYWSFIMFLGNIVTFFSSAQSIVDTEKEKLAPLSILLPVYWMFLGMASFASFFRSTKYFGRTEKA